MSMRRTGTGSVDQQMARLHAVRQVEGEGVLRMMLLALSVAMPLATMAYLKMQHMSISYEMSEIRTRIKEEEEENRKLLLERSQYQRDEEIQDFANQHGLKPRQQSYMVPRSFTREDQKMAKLSPVSSARTQDRP